MMSERQYSYKKDWDDIYRIPGNKPWEKTGIPPYLKTLFGDSYFRNNYAKANILDVGCGKGDLCEYLSDLGYEKVTGVDVSKVILDQCRKSSKVDYEWMDVVNGDFSTHKKYDIVVCWFLLHHIKPEHIEKLVINLFNLCESNGMLILSFLLPGKDRKSFFSDDHNVSLYPVERVVNDFSPYFRIIRTAEEDKNLLDRPDEHQERYHYHVLRMKKDVKEELSGKILEFKKNIFSPIVPFTDVRLQLVRAFAN